MSTTVDRDIKELKEVKEFTNITQLRKIAQESLKPIIR
jgi:hypothetical protein